MKLYTQEQLLMAIDYAIQQQKDYDYDHISNMIDNLDQKTSLTEFLYNGNNRVTYDLAEVKLFIKPAEASLVLALKESHEYAFTAGENLGAVKICEVYDLRYEAVPYTDFEEWYKQQEEEKANKE